MSDEPRRRTVIYDIPKPVEHKLRVLAALEGKSFQDKVRELLNIATEQCSITPIEGGDDANRKAT